MSNVFTNFSKLKKECPRCGEENDKCGVFEEIGFVMCRTDTNDSIEPKLDANGWEYWPYQINEGDKYSEIYNSFINMLTLSNDDNQALLSRGFDEVTIQRNEYRTIPHKSGKEGLNESIEILDQKYDLDGVPGFYLKDGKRSANAQYKQTVIPVRSFSGNIIQFVLRNNNNEDSKRKSKYIMFSSDGKEDGGKVSPSIHFPLGVENCNHELRITEGILKADITTKLGGIYCIGLHGLSTRGLLPAIEMLGVSKVHLAIDIDWKTNANVMNGLRRIYNVINNAGYEILVEEWNEHDGKGIDDVLLSKGRMWTIPKEEIEFIMETPVFDRQNWVYINKTSQFAKIDCAPIYLMDEKHFNNHFAKFRENFASEAKSSIKQTNSVTYKPLSERIIFKDNFFDLNLWADTGISARENKESNLDLFHSHMDYLFQKDKKQKELFLDWMAHVVQNRGKKFSYAMLLHGEQGTGKTWAVHCLSLILGESNVEYITNSYLNNQFNSLMQGKELLIVNEIMSEGKKAFMNRMKDLIDTKSIIINTKGVPEYKIDFLTNWFLTTNYDDEIYIEDNDRKYLVLSSDAKCGDENEAYERGKKLFAWSGGGKEEYPINVDNLAALHKFLLDRKTSHSPFAKAPDTQAKTHMQEESLSQFEQFVKERINEEMWPFNSDLVCVEHIKLFPAIEKRFGRITPQKWGKTLRRFGAIPFGTRIGENGKVDSSDPGIKIRMENEGGKQRKVWILRRYHTYLKLTSKEIENLYVSKRPANTEENIDYGEPM